MVLEILGKVAVIMVASAIVGTVAGATAAAAKTAFDNKVNAKQAKAEAAK